MTERDTLALNLFQNKLKSSKIGVLAKGLYGIDIKNVVSELAKNATTPTFVSVVGYNVIPYTTNMVTISIDIGDAISWRSIPERAGHILVLVKEDMEKLHSLAELDLVTMRDLTTELIQNEIKSAQNEPIRKFWTALTEQSSYHKYEAIEQFINSIHSVGASNTAIPSSMWCLYLLRDDSILNDKANPAEALIANRRLLADAGQLSAEATKRLSSWLTHANNDERAELFRKYHMLQRFIEFGDNKYLKDLDFATVKKLLSVSKKPEVVIPPQPGTDDPQPESVKNHQIKIKEIDGDLIEALFNNDTERISDIGALFEIAEKQMISDDDSSESPISPDGGYYDGREVESPNNRTPMRQLVGRVCHEDAWGGVLTSKENTLKDVISANDNVIHLINPRIDDHITSFDSRSLFNFMCAVDDLELEGHIAFRPIIEKLIESRSILLKHIDAIMFCPIWAFGTNSELCEELFKYVDLWGELFSACKNNYSALKIKSTPGSKTIARAIVLMDTLFIHTQQEWKAIVMPLNPLFLWRYYEVFKSAKIKKRKSFSKEDINDIKEAISKLPQVINVIIADSLITGGENKPLPNSGSIDSLPTFENKVNRYIGSDGIQEFAEILERWVGFSPFSQNELRICAVDVPDFTAFLRAINAFMNKPSGCGRVIIQAFMTRNQNFNNELSALDYSGKDFGIGELIKNSRLEVTFRSVNGPSEIKEALSKKPVHIAIYFDQSKYKVQYEPSHKTLYVTPLVVTYDYSYDRVTHRGTIAPSSDTTSGIIGDYHRVLEQADIVETDMNAQMTYTETEDLVDIVSTIENHSTQWLVIADRITDSYEPPYSIPIGEQHTDKRTINTWAAADSRIITQYVSMLCSYNLYPTKEILYEILRRFGHIASNGLISIPKFGSNGNAIENEKKGLVGTLFAAVKYTQDFSSQIPLVASLDTDNAKRWLRDSKFGNERADLIGMRYDKQSDILYVDAIEVKTRDNNTDITYNADGSLSGHAAEQIATVVFKLFEIFGMSEDSDEDMFVAARKEVLKFQIVSECFRKTHDSESKGIWEGVFRRAFASKPTIRIEIGGILYHFNLSINSGGYVIDSFYSEMPECRIKLYTLSTAEIQKEIFDHEEGDDSHSSSEIITEENENGEVFVDLIDPQEVGEDIREAVSLTSIENLDVLNVSTREVLFDSSAEGTNNNSMSEDIINSNIEQVVKPFIESTKFLIGKDVKTEEKYYWEFGNKNLNNRHLLINGNSGSGKTYCIQGLLLEAVSNGVSAVVFDYTGGFTSGKLDPAFKKALGNRVTQRIIKTTKVPINPFLKHDNVIDEDTVIPEDNVDVASKISSIFTKIYSLGDQQKSAVYTAVLNGLRTYGDSMSFSTMAAELENIDSGPARSVLSKIRAFIDMEPFNSSESMNWGDIRDSGGSIYVIQLAGFERDVQILLTELMLWDIWSFCVKSGGEDKPFIIVMDEAQNLDHGEKSPSAKILTEGRKFGISGWYATQFMRSQLSEDEIQRLQQASQKLYFCPPDDGIITIAKNIDISPQGTRDWAERLKKLKKGECVTCGNMIRNGLWVRYNPRIIKITAISERLME